MRVATASVLVVVAAMLVWADSPASANWFGGTGNARDVDPDDRCDGGNMQQDKDVTFGCSNTDMTAEVRGAVNFTRNEFLNPTELDTTEIDNYGAHIDVLVIAKRYSVKPRPAGRVATSSTCA